jgi:hypothetical protein
VGRSLRAECTYHPGRPRFRELDEQRVLGDIRAALAAAAQLGHLDTARGHVRALMLAAVNGMALLVARSADPAVPLPGVKDTFTSSYAGCCPSVRCQSSPYTANIGYQTPARERRGFSGARGNSPLRQ